MKTKLSLKYKLLPLLALVLCVGWDAIRPKDDSDVPSYRFTSSELKHILVNYLRDARQNLPLLERPVAVGNKTIWEDDPSVVVKLSGDLNGDVTLSISHPATNSGNSLQDPRTAAWYGGYETGVKRALDASRIQFDLLAHTGHLDPALMDRFVQSGLTNNPYSR